MTAILFVDHAPAMGGAEHSLLLLLNHLDKGQWQPHLAGTAGPLLEQAETAAIHTHLVSLPRLRRSLRFPLDGWRQAGALAHIARKTPVQAFHANTVRAALYTAVAAQRARLPFIWHMRDFWLSEARPARLWLDTLGKRLLVAAATRVITNSQAVAAHLPASLKIRVIHNGIDLSQFDPGLDGRSFRHSFHIPDEAPLVGMVGRLRPWKGQKRLLKVARQVLTQLPNAYFAVVGGAPFEVGDGYAQELTELRQQYGLNDRVIFTGQLGDVRPALAAMDVFVHPGDPEPFGLVNVEAMAMVKPVVAFAHGALPEIVIDGETGKLVMPDNVAQMAQAVVTLLQDPPTAHHLGQNGRLRAKSHFDIRRTAAQIEAIYSEILNHK